MGIPIKIEEVCRNDFLAFHVGKVKSKYPHLRQESKAPTFACTYQGTYRTMMTNLGWSEEKARAVEANYHKLYAVSTQWVQDQIAEAAKKGYAEAAFGLRIRTPLLRQSLMGTSITPREAEAEARTLGNAISGQSYGLLNSRAANEFMEKVWNSKYRLDVLPVAQIHDAQYYLIKDDPDVLTWVNKELTASMAWQDLPEIAHPEVHLGAELDIYWPNWSNGITLPNQATEEDIKQLCAQGKNYYLNQIAHKKAA
jgi:DNA polymerase I